LNNNRAGGSESSKKKRAAAGGIGFQDLNLAGYSHQNVDRFAVLLDIWTNEVNFLEMKRNVSYFSLISLEACYMYFKELCFKRLKLLDVYFEVYQNTFDKSEKRNLAQILTNLMHRRVRFDLDANYFTSTYRLEVSCLYKQIKIVKTMLDKMVN
jgi:hypothetical protein